MTPDRATRVERTSAPKMPLPGGVQGHLERELEIARATVKAQQQELNAHKQQLERLQSTVYERDFQLASARKMLTRSESLLESWRRTVQEQERELMDGEAKLMKVELRAERLEETLASIRAGHAYKIVRIIWWLRRPFKRPPRATD